MALCLLTLGWFKLKSIPNKAACFFLASGIFGNLLDRARFAFVIDWIFVSGRLRDTSIQWPVFNLADVFIGWGIALFILAPLLNRIPSLIARHNGFSS
jgi:lipoprotein signal peptidase